MDQWRTVLTVEIGPRTCRVSVVEQQHPAHVYAAATGQPVPTGDYGAVVSYEGSYDPPERIRATFTRATTTPAPTTPDDVRALLDLALAVPGRHRDDRDVAAAVAIRRPCPDVDVEDLLAGLLPGVPAASVDALDVLGRGAVIGDVLVALDAGADDHGDPLVHSALYDDLGRRLSDPHTDTLNDLAALIRQDVRLGQAQSTGINHLLGDAATRSQPVCTAPASPRAPSPATASAHQRPSTPTPPQQSRPPYPACSGRTDPTDHLASADDPQAARDGARSPPIGGWR